MTDREKARAYDIIIERAYKKRAENCDACKACIEELIPEIKKSEDERIRKCLLSHFSRYREDEVFLNDILMKDIVSWLEKQDEKGTKGNEGEIPNSEQNLADITDKLKEEYQKGWNAAMQQLPKEVDSQIWQIANNSAKTWEESFAILCATQKAYGKGKKDALKEQNIVVIIPKFRVGDEIKTSNEESLTITKIDKKGYWSEGLFICSFDDAAKWELVEQKSADNVEHEFEIGDLITNGILVGKIDEIHELGYHAYFGDHYADVPDVENWHKWTIQDSKDGDVLVTNSNIIFIFKYLDEGGTIAFRASCTENSGVYFPKIKERLCDQDAHPATKEQRNLLFQKMREAGYGWDDKNKEPKKIEQTVWSEEDEKYTNIVVSALGSPSIDGLYCFHNVKSADVINWFKSIKDKVQPKQEWNEQEQVRINRIVSCLENLNVADNDILLKDVEWLKSIRPQSRWKPSGEQIKALAMAVEGNIPQPGIIQSILEQLKKL